MMKSRLGPGQEKGRQGKQVSRSRALAVVSVTRHPTCILGDSVHILLPHLSHVAQHGKDDKTRQEAGQTVHRACDQSVSVMEKEKDGTAGKRQHPPQIHIHSSAKCFHVIT